MRKVACINPKTNIPDNFKYVDLESVVGTSLIKAKLTTKQLAPSRAQRVAKKGDIFYQTVRPYQKNNFLFDINNYDFQYVFSTGYAQLRSEINNYFLFSYLQRQRFVNLILRRSTGTSYPAISSKDLSEIKIIFPRNSKEQENIGKIINLIDALITLQQRKLNLLEQLKKGLLQKIFTKENTFYPTLRFQNFNLDWKQYKLNDLVKIDTGKLDANAMVSNGKYDFYTSGIKKYKINNYAFKGPAITIAGNGATVGYMHYADNKFNAYQRTYVLTDLKADRRFLFNSIQLILPHKIYQESRTGNIPYIVLSMLTDLLIMVPSNKEQTFIGNLAGTISDIYNKQLKKLNLTNQLKKSLLQQMFI